MRRKWRHDDGEETRVVIEAIVEGEVALAFRGAAFAESEKAGEIGV